MPTQPFCSHQSNQLLTLFKENPFQWCTQQRYLFGIIDCKITKDGTVKILEMGNGCYSSFSGHGAWIMEHFLNDFWQETDDKQIYLPFHVMVGDKFLTHCFLSQTLETLRPKCLPFKRDVPFSLEYVNQILCKVEHYFSNCNLFVLKLNNYSMGRGIFLVQKQELHSLLCKLLNLQLLNNEEEQELYWKICDCTIFLIEEYVTNSKLVSENEIDFFNPTMRVAFAMDVTNDCHYEHLGSYWKLPCHSFTEQVERSNCISNVEEGGTMATKEEEDQLVNSLFAQVLPTFFKPIIAYGTVKQALQTVEKEEEFGKWLTLLRSNLAMDFVKQVEEMCTIHGTMHNMSEEYAEYLHYFYYSVALHLLESGDAACCPFTTILIQEKLLQRQSMMARAEMHRAYAMQLLQAALLSHAKEDYNSLMLQNTCNSVLLQFQQALLLNPYFVDCSLSLSQYFFSLAKFCFSKDSTSEYKKQLLEYAYESLEDALFAYYRLDIVLLLLNIQVHRGEDVTELMIKCGVDFDLLDEDSQEIISRQQ